MKPFSKNLLKTLTGIFVGIPILSITDGMNYILQSALLCVYFTIYYTIVDLVYDKWFWSRYEMPDDLYKGLNEVASNLYTTASIISYLPDEYLSKSPLYPVYKRLMEEADLGQFNTRYYCQKCDITFLYREKDPIEPCSHCGRVLEKKD